MQTLKTLETQVAGHANTIFEIEDGKVLKQASILEIDFYKAIQSHPLAEFMPKFYTDTTDTITIENLTSKFKYPCVCDVKIGKRLYDDNATPDKRARMIQQAEETTSGSTGLRICGMQIVSQSMNVKRDRKFGRSLTAETIASGFEAFCKNEDGNLVNRSVLHSFIQKLNNIIQVFQGSNGLRLYASSVLLIYDGDLAWDGASDANASLKLIDFAHSHYSKEASVGHDHFGPDQGVLFGLENLKRILTDLRDFL